MILITALIIFRYIILKQVDFCGKLRIWNAYSNEKKGYDNTIFYDTGQSMYFPNPYSVSLVLFLIVK